ncbi:MAG: alpha-hydroxy-acid oxidizing protein [Actinomycetota bacterium]|nr:alpha-hydroxy-acid oxidizing protein [Actinomycetota bacterium]
MELEKLFGVHEFESLARDKLSAEVNAYVTDGAGGEVTIAENEAAFSRYRLRPRVLVDVSEIDPSAELLGRRVALPVGLAPTGWQRFVHADGELASGRAAGRCGVPLCLSTASNFSLEDVAAAHEEMGGGLRWFQLYFNRDRGLVENLLHRSKEHGYEAIVVTADLPVLGYRESQFRHEMTPSENVAPANYDAYARDRSLSSAELLEGFTDPSLTWDDLPWIAEVSQLPVVVKGIMTAEDARAAVEHGISGIVVSNHGGRQLDRTSAAIDVLEEVVTAVEGRAEVYLDGGVRRGVDVLTALALGARAVFVGRPYLWGLAVAGEAGVVRVLEILRDEVLNAMALLGVTKLDHVDRTKVCRASGV